MRIISGAAHGRSLYTLKGQNTRPTADRVKEAVFSVLGNRVVGARVLDAFAGSAALGLEALSRGAASALFFEADAAAARVCRRNMDLCGLPGGRLIRGDCLKLLPRLSRQEDLRFDLVFADPPYNRGLLPRLLEVLAQGGLLAPEALVVAETTARDSEFAPSLPWQVWKSSVYGSTAVHYCRLTAIEIKEDDP